MDVKGIGMNNWSCAAFVAAVITLAGTAKGTDIATVWVDIDTDGIEDMLRYIPGERPQVLRNRGDGQFDILGLSPHGQIPRVSDAATADLDQDGLPEIIVAGKDGSWILGVGPDGLKIRTKLRGASRIDVRDFDDDGRPDLVLGAALYRQRTDGSWSELPLPILPGASPGSTSEEHGSEPHSREDQSAPPTTVPGRSDTEIPSPTMGPWPQGKTTGHSMAASEDLTLGLNGDLVIGGHVLASGTGNHHFLGNVGIGTLEPQARLDVDDDVSVGGNLLIHTPWRGIQFHDPDPAAHRYDLIAGSTAGNNPVGGFGLYDDSAFSYRLFVESTGDVGIGTTTPDHPLHVAGDIGVQDGRFGRSAVTLFANNSESGTGGLVTVHNESGTDGVQVIGDDSGSGAGAIEIADAFGNEVISMSARTGITKTPVVQITGGSDLSEPFEITGSSPDPGMVLVIDPAHSQKLRICDEAYDRRVAGIVSGAGGVRPGLEMNQEGTFPGGHSVALAGRVFCWADAGHGGIEPGDLLTTSATPGYAMKAQNLDRAQGAILGKAMTGLAEGRKGLVLVLVSMQ